MQFVAFGLVFDHAFVGGTELNFVKTVAETFGGFGHFLVDFIVVFGQLVFNENIGTVAFFGIFVVDQRVVECVHVTGCFPDGRMHENSGIEPHHVVIEQYHGVPPVFLDVVFEFHTHLSIVIDSRQAIVNLTGRKYKSIFLAMRNELLKYVFLLSHFKSDYFLPGCKVSDFFALYLPYYPLFFYERRPRRRRYRTRRRFA